MLNPNINIPKVAPAGDRKIAFPLPFKGRVRVGMGFPRRSKHSLSPY